MEFEGTNGVRGLVTTMSSSLDQLTPQHSGSSVNESVDGASRRRSVSEEEPPECRVCRGEPEPGRRLHAPCLCSGSIMHTHEDCLLEWLTHSGKDSCELCGATFRFTPVYDPNAPSRLPVWQVLATCAKKMVVRWLPFLVRVIIVASLWLVFVPVCTSWLYRIWIHRTRVLLPQLFFQRLTAARIWSDCISGIIVTAAIILSFLSLMTFADFLAEQLLRDEWNDGVNGMNLVEAMAEAMDGMRNNRNELPRLEALAHPNDNADAGGLGQEAARGDLEQHHQAGQDDDQQATDAGVDERDNDQRFSCTVETAMGADVYHGTAQESTGAEPDGGASGDEALAGTASERHQRVEAEVARAGSRGSSNGAGVASAGTSRNSNNHGAASDRSRDSDIKLWDTRLELDHRPPTPARGWRGGSSSRNGSVDSRSGSVTGVEEYGLSEASSMVATANETASAIACGASSANATPPPSPLRIPTRPTAVAAVAVAREAGARNAVPEFTPPEPTARRTVRSASKRIGAAVGASTAETADGDVRDAPVEDQGPVIAHRAEAPLAGNDAGGGAAEPRVGAGAPAAAQAVAGEWAGAGFRAGAAAAEPLRGRAEDDRLAAPAVPPAVVAGEGAGDGEAEENNDDVDDGLLDGDMDVHMAIDELLGLRGPITTLLRNVLWLLAFHGAYLGLFAFFPFSIGASVVHAVSKYLDPHVLGSLGRRSEYLALRNIVQGWYVLATSSEEQEDTLRLPDLATICLGYMVMSTMVFMWRGIINAVSERTNTQILLQARKAMRVTAAVVKVGLLLSLKMLLMPLLLGVCLDATTLPVFGCTGEARARFMAQHLVGSLLLHWVLGITFMLFVTVSVLQLREVVHPDLLSLIIRPQEPHPDLLGSLLQESGRTHARRMAMSLAIYLALVAMLVWAPTKLMGLMFPGVMPVQLELRYGMPQLQMPMELVILHLAMLAFLEKNQNRIGEMQHAWLVAACGGLGLTRYLLPQPIIARHPPRRGPSGDEVARAGRIARWGLVVKAWWDGGEEGKDAEEGIVVGPPLRRPPPGWDDPAGVAQGRWAWGQEPPGEVQRKLAPRRRHGARAVPLLALLLALAWTTILAVVLSLVVLPFLLGRAVFALLYLPPEWTHDTASFTVGLTVLKVITPVLYRVWCAARLQLFPPQQPLPAEEQARRRVREQAATINRRSVGRRGNHNLRQDNNHQQQQRQERQRLQSEQKRARRRGVLILAAGAALWFIVAPVLAAWLFQMAFVVRADGRGIGGERGSAGARGWAVGVLLSSLGGSPGRAMALGCFLLHTWAYVCQAGAPRWVHAAIRTVGLGLQQEQPQQQQQQQPRAERGAARGADGRREGGGGAQAEGRPLSWKDRIERALSTVETGLVRWDMENVSYQVLVRDFAGAVVVRLIVMIVFPLAYALGACAWRARGNVFPAGCSQLPDFRIALLSMVLTRVSLYLTGPAAVWLKTLHDIVRDDRYLVEMRLQDHADKATIQRGQTIFGAECPLDPPAAAAGAADGAGRRRQ